MTAWSPDAERMARDIAEISGEDEWGRRFAVAQTWIDTLVRAGAQTFDKIGADRLADEVDVLVIKRVIDHRDPAADALLDYRDPPTSVRSDRLAFLEKRIAEIGSAFRKFAAETPYAEEAAGNGKMLAEVGTLRAQLQERERAIDTLYRRLEFIDNHAMLYTQSAVEREDTTGELRRQLVREIREAARGKLPDWATEKRT